MSASVAGAILRGMMGRFCALVKVKMWEAMKREMIWNDGIVQQAFLYTQSPSARSLEDLWRAISASHFGQDAAVGPGAADPHSESFLTSSHHSMHRLPISDGRKDLSRSQ